MTMRSVLLPPLVLLLITACVPSRSMDLRFPNQTVELRVGTYNIRSGLSTDGSLRLEKIAREIEHARLDLVFLQEVDRGTRRADRRNRAEELGRLLGMEWVYAVADRTMDGGQLGNAILSRYPIEQSGGKRLPGSIFRVRRSITYAVIAGPHEMRLLAVSGHFSLEQADRQASSQWAAQQLSELDGPVIAGFDLNASPGSTEIESLRNAVALSSPLPTYPAQNPQYAIDRIVASPPAHVTITDTGAGPLGNSDHLLLVSTLRIDPVSHACQ